jgi:hypothetical protein
MRIPETLVGEAMPRSARWTLALNPASAARLLRLVSRVPTGGRRFGHALHQKGQARQTKQVATAREDTRALHRDPVDYLTRGQAAGLVGCQDSNLDALAGKPPADLQHVSLDSPDRRGEARRDLEHTEVGCSSRHDYDADRGAGPIITERPHGRRYSGYSPRVIKRAA